MLPAHPDRSARGLQAKVDLGQSGTLPPRPRLLLRAAGGMVPAMAGRPFVFLDRDGTLIEDVNYGHRPEDYHPIAGVTAALRRLCAAGFGLAIVTNQAGIGRGLFTRADYDSFHGRLLDDLAAAGIEIEATYMCPHAPDEGCSCRKPAPTSLFAARDELGADLEASWMIGDHAKDVEFGHNAGCRAILVLTGHGEEEEARLGERRPVAVVANLPAAVALILGDA